MTKKLDAANLTLATKLISIIKSIRLFALKSIIFFTSGNNKKVVLAMSQTRLQE